MKQIQANHKQELYLGRQGENLARQVIFDVSGWEAEYGPGTVELIVQRPEDEAPYPVSVKRQGGHIIWDVTAVDTAVTTGGRYGRCELRYYVGDVLAKSDTWRLWVSSAMETPTETAPSEPEQGWMDQVLAAGAAAKASADAAKADADRVAALAAEVAANADGTAQAKEAAQTARRLAENARGAAETAQKAAEAAQKAAAQSAGDADAAKLGAEASLRDAQSAASAAAQALADLRTLYQELQTWADGVTRTVNEAGGNAIQSVQSAGDAQVQRVTEEGTTQTANAKAQADAAAQSAAEAADSKAGAEAAQDKAETAAVKQPFPNAETGTWWVWGANAGTYQDTGIGYGGGVSDLPAIADGDTGKSLVVGADGKAAWGKPSASLPLVASITLTEEVSMIEISQDMDGNPLALEEMDIWMYLYGGAGNTNRDSSLMYLNGMNTAVGRFKLGENIGASGLYLESSQYFIKREYGSRRIGQYGYEIYQNNKNVVANNEIKYMDGSDRNHLKKYPKYTQVNIYPVTDGYTFGVGTRIDIYGR